MISTLETLCPLPGLGGITGILGLHDPTVHILQYGADEVPVKAQKWQTVSTPSERKTFEGGHESMQNGYTWGRPEPSTQTENANEQKE